MRGNLRVTGLAVIQATLLLAIASAARAQTPVEPAAPVPAATHTGGTAMSQGTSSAPNTQPVDETAKPSTGVLVDQVIAVVNGDLVLESDVDEERRFAVFQPFSTPSGEFSREQAIERLIDRALIVQQARLQPEEAVTLAQAKAELITLRKELPGCPQYHCDTDEGWKKFVNAQGFTLGELELRWQQRMEILKFIEQRFRMGIRISPEEIRTYYEKTMLPEYARQKAKAPPLDTISERIQEVLLQKQVSNLLNDWLQSLKAQGSVRMMKPGEVQP